MKPATDGFESQTTKPPVSSVLHTRPPPLEACHRRLRPPGRQVFQSLRSTCSTTILTRSTRSLLHVHLRLLMSPSVSHHGWSPGLLVPQSKPHARPSLLPVHRHDTSLLDLHLTIDHRLRAPHLRTTSQEACCTTQLMPWLVHKLHKLNLGRESH